MKKLWVFFLVILAGVGMSCAKKAGGKIELNFLEVMGSPSRTAEIKKIIAEYEGLHPDITINLISPPYEQSDNRAAQALSAKEPLDIIEVRDFTASIHVTNSWVEDLTPYIDKWPGWNGLLASVKDLAAAAGGKPYMIPQFIFVPALFVRTDVLAKLGETKMPSTIQELFAMAARITKPSESQYGFSIRGKGNPFRQSDLMILSNVNNVDTASFYQLKDGTSVFDSPEFLAAFRAYVDLFKNAVPSDGVNWGFNEQITSFASGITPFLMQDPDAVAVVDEHISRDQYTVIPMPLGSSGAFYFEPGFTGLGIPPYSKYKDQAWDFITFMTAPERNAAICKAYGALPVNSSTYEEDSYFSSGVYQAWAAVLASPEKYVMVRYPYTNEKFPGWSQVQAQYLQSTFLGQTTPEEAVKAWSDYWK
ncbi:MAG: sugar ABC transporter substrate-binding protein [Treponema sp.]|jgi:multiple sugar transport system substrate-binding protein|nr:sugar ABC transporter substrate-binding protein [Treponema sp.]